MEINLKHSSDLDIPAVRAYLAFLQTSNMPHQQNPGIAVLPRVQLCLDSRAPSSRRCVCHPGEAPFVPEGARMPRRRPLMPRFPQDEVRSGGARVSRGSNRRPAGGARTHHLSRASWAWAEAPRSPSVRAGARAGRTEPEPAAWRRGRAAEDSHRCTHVSWSPRGRRVRRPGTTADQRRLSHLRRSELTGGGAGGLLLSSPLLCSPLSSLLPSPLPSPLSFPLPSPSAARAAQPRARARPASHPSSNAAAGVRVRACVWRCVRVCVRVCVSIVANVCIIYI